MREARRIEGRTTFTECDARIAAGSDRAPIDEDAIVIAEFLLDSHGCRLAYAAVRRGLKSRL